MNPRASTDEGDSQIVDHPLSKIIGDEIARIEKGFSATSHGVEGTISNILSFKDQPKSVLVSEIVKLSTLYKLQKTELAAQVTELESLEELIRRYIHR